MDKNEFFCKGGPVPTNRQLLDTRLFYHNSGVIYTRFREWKDNDKFYFTPLFMRMTYSIGGIGVEFAPDPVWLGSFVRTSLSHPDLFAFNCPKCRRVLYPYRYCGSPLSGRVDLEGGCPCGWKGYVIESGWFMRGEALRKQIAADKDRHDKYELIHPGAKSATIDELLAWLER
ncbi:MAG: hypothetical protein IJK05_05415 [Bacteroidales bacterium]|nr:hypothetical protein [Bacteroidales bacterium]